MTAYILLLHAHKPSKWIPQGCGWCLFPGAAWLCVCLGLVCVCVLPCWCWSHLWARAGVRLLCDAEESNLCAIARVSLPTCFSAGCKVGAHVAQLVLLYLELALSLRPSSCSSGIMYLTYAFGVGTDQVHS
jgi:hypothetical protein